MEGPADNSRGGPRLLTFRVKICRISLGPTNDIVDVSFSILPFQFGVPNFIQFWQMLLTHATRWLWHIQNRSDGYNYPVEHLKWTKILWLLTDQIQLLHFRLLSSQFLRVKSVKPIHEPFIQPWTVSNLPPVRSSLCLVHPFTWNL